jgi:hypothetical protein
MPEYKTTFNYLLTHRVIPNLYYENFDYFYEKIIANPDTMQKFLESAMQIAAETAKENPQIEPPFIAEQFQVGIQGRENPDTAVIIINIPEYDKDLDSVQIAFPLNYEKPNYYTLELSTNPLTNERYYTLGSWTKAEKGLKHNNHGEIEITSQASFGEKLIEMAGGETTQ